MRRLLTAAVLVFVGLAACTSGRTTTGARTSPVTLVLVTHDSFDVRKSVLGAFEERSGIQVKVLPVGDAGQLVNRAILAAGKPEGDVLFGIDNNLLAEALAKDVFIPYASPRLSAIPDAFKLDAGNRVTPIDSGDVCVNDDLAEYTDKPAPRSLEDLADPRYRGELVVENPATSTPGLAFLLATVAAYGDPGFEDYWRRLRSNDVMVVDGWEQAYYGQFSGAGGGEGSRPLVVSYATSPVAEMVFAEQPLDRPPTGVLTGTCFRQIEFAGILRGTEHEAAARKLIDFMLSRAFQQDIPLRMFVTPVRSDVSLPKVFSDSAIDPEAPYTLSPEQVAAGRADWVRRWTDIMLR